jgi:hypothetical protein
MNIAFIEQSAFDELNKKVDFIFNKISAQDSDCKPELLTNEQLISLLGISKRTAQNYRDKGLIAFSQVGKKIFYKRENVDSFITANQISQNSEKQLSL